MPRWLEMMAVYLGGTLGAYLLIRAAPNLVIPLILAAGAAAWFASARLGRLAPKPSGRTRTWQREIGRILALWCCLGAILAVATRLLAPDLWLSFPRQRPALWLIVMLLYPLLSALPQEVLFRRLFFQRYGPLFPAESLAVLVNGLLFGLAHVVMDNAVAVIATVPFGWLLAWTYVRTGSLWLAWLEHTLYGGLAFTCGLGIYFIPAERAREVIDAPDASALVSMAAGCSLPR